MYTRRDCSFELLPRKKLHSSVHREQKRVENSLCLIIYRWYSLGRVKHNLAELVPEVRRLFFTRRLIDERGLKDSVVQVLTDLFPSFGIHSQDSNLSG